MDRKAQAAPQKAPTFQGIAGTGLPAVLPAMPESPIPDLAPRNRTPDPLARHAAAGPAQGQAVTGTDAGPRDASPWAVEIL